MKSEIDGLVWNRLILRLAETLAATLKTMDDNCGVLPNNEPLFRRTVSLMENLLNDKDNPLHIGKNDRKRLKTYFDEISDAIGYDIIKAEYQKNAANC